MKLVIVETEGKVKGLSKFLDADYEVVTCYGPIRSFPKNEIGVTVTEKDVSVQFVSPEKSERTMEFLKKKVSKAEIVYLACDPDDEGEFMAFHLQKNLAQDKNDCKRFKRIRLHALTEKDIKDAFGKPVDVKSSWVAAQLTQRVFDRIVAYKMAPILANTFGKGVPTNLRQAVALKFIVDRENEIAVFTAKEYYEIFAQFSDQKYMLHTGEGKVHPTWLQKSTADTLMDILAVKPELTVNSVEFVNRKDKPPEPFNTFTMLQVANKVLGLTADETMQAARKLYEWGYITYMFTRSTFVSDDAVKMAHDHIMKKYGKDFIGKGKSKGNGYRGCHGSECIRPTKLVSGMNLVEPERDLLQLISKRFIASQMADCNVTFQVIKAGNPSLEYAAQKNNRYADLFFQCMNKEVMFPGYRQLLNPDDVEYELIDYGHEKFWAVAEGDKLKVDFICSAGQTEAPKRFTDATLVRDFESAGVGTPCAMAKMVKMLKYRNYVEMDGAVMQPTERGRKINEFLEEWFSEFISEDFVSQMERQLELVAGEEKWKPFVIAFDQKMESVLATMKK